LRKAKIGLGLPLLVVLVIAVVIVIAAVLSFRLFMEGINSLLGSVVGGIANAITIIILNTLYTKLAYKLTEWENYRTRSEFDNALTFKIIMFYFVSSYTSLFYMAFFKNGTDFWGAKVKSLHDACEVGNESGIGFGCPDELTVQLATILGINMVVGQAQEVLVPYIMSKVQLIRLMKETGETKDEIPEWEENSKLSDFAGTLPEYTEMIIQFGYITLFASAFPLAPFLAVMNNMVEIRTDAFKLLTSYKRPDYRGAVDIGIWYDILEAFGIIAVITNCLLVGFTFSAIPELFDSPLTRAFFTLVVIVCMEHAILVIKYFLSMVIPDVPGDISKKIVFQEFCKEQIFKKMTGVKIDVVLEQHDDLNDVDALIAANEQDQLNPLGLTLSTK